MIHILGGMEQDDTGSHHATPNREQFKTYKLFISGIFLFIFSDCGELWVTEIAEGEIAGKGGSCTVQEASRKVSNRGQAGGMQRKTGRGLWTKREEMEETVDFVLCKHLLK